MEIFLNWLIDFGFYGFLDSLIIYFFIAKIILNKKIVLKNMIKHSIIISFGISLITTFIQILGLSQLIMGIYIGICIKYFFKLNFKKCLFYGMCGMIFLTSIEYLVVLTIDYFMNINIFNYKLNELIRILPYFISKVIEIILLKGGLNMKGLIGSTVKR